MGVIDAIHGNDPPGTTLNHTWDPHRYLVTVPVSGPKGGGRSTGGGRDGRGPRLVQADEFRVGIER